MESTIKEFLRRQGVDLIGFTSAEDFKEWHEVYNKRIDDGLFPSDYPDRMSPDPRKFLPGARSIIVFGIKGHGLSEVKDPGRGSIGGIMWVRKREREIKALLVEFLKESGAHAAAGSPIPEKAAAVRAGLAIQRKNTVAYFGDHGSAVRIGTVITDLELPSESKTGADACGNCTLCLEACPTGALLEDYVLDVNRCLTYLTEEDCEFPRDLRPGLGNKVLACDVCQLVCPHNKDVDRLSFDEVEWLELKSLAREAIEDPEALNTRFSDQLLFYINSDFGLSRAIAISLGNWGDPEVVPLLRRMEESRFPEVVEAARWSLDQVKPAE